MLIGKGPQPLAVWDVCRPCSPCSSLQLFGGRGGYEGVPLQECDWVDASKYTDSATP